MTKESSGFVFGTAHAGLVLTAIGIFGGAWVYQSSSLTGVEKQLEQAQADKVNAITARNRSDDVQNSRIAALESRLNNCKH